MRRQEDRIVESYIIKEKNTGKYWGWAKQRKLHKRPPHFQEDSARVFHFTLLSIALGTEFVVNIHGSLD